VHITNAHHFMSKEGANSGTWLEPGSIPVIDPEHAALAAHKASSTYGVGESAEFEWALAVIEALPQETRAAIHLVLRRAQFLTELVKDFEAERAQRYEARAILMERGSADSHPFVTTAAKLGFEGSFLDQIQHAARLAIRSDLERMDAISTRAIEMQEYEAHLKSTGDQAAE